MEYLHKYHYQPAEVAARGELPPLDASPIWLLGHRYDPDVGLSEDGLHDELHVVGGPCPRPHPQQAPIHHKPPASANSSNGGSNKEEGEGEHVHEERKGAEEEEDEDYGPPTVFTMLHGAERRWASFLAHFRSVVWCTYRAAFPRLGSDAYTSDMGWGCMLRTGQMVLAQALTRHLLGTEWRRQSDRSSPLYAKMVQWFADDPKQPFSLHRIAHAGLKYGKNVGEWFGPSTMAQVLEELLKEFSPSGLRAYVCQDGGIYLDQLRRTATTHWPHSDEEDEDEDGEGWAPLLIMLPLRLGLDRLNEDYIPVLKQTFRIPQSLGISGGKPRASLYFVGNQDDNVFYLDPHTVQPAPRFPEFGDVPASEDVYDTFHCSAPLRLRIQEIDPSLCLAFYCRDRDDFDDFCARAIELTEGSMPIFTVAERMPDYLVRPKPPKHSEKLFSDDEDDVVFL